MSTKVDLTGVRRTFYGTPVVASSSGRERGTSLSAVLNNDIYAIAEALIAFFLFLACGSVTRTCESFAASGQEKDQAVV